MKKKNDLKLVLSNSAKRMHELSSSFRVGTSTCLEIMKNIELCASRGSYFFTLDNLTYEESSQIKEYVEKEGYKCKLHTPDEFESDTSYFLVISW